ncbi:hypothetical protein H4R33_002420 [Dimargaris cristalligena]|nr:hypothetical protein H4R33_002420 [Dimargaris cristalligena]
MNTSYYIEPQTYRLGAGRPMTLSFSTELMSAFEKYLDSTTTADLSAEDTSALTDVRAAHAKLTSKEPRPTGATSVPATFTTDLQGYIHPELNLRAFPSDPRDSFEEQNVFRSSCISQKPSTRKSSIRQEVPPLSPRADSIAWLPPDHLIDDSLGGSGTGSGSGSGSGASSIGSGKRWSLPFRRKRESIINAPSALSSESISEPEPSDELPESPITPITPSTPAPESPIAKRHSIGNLVSLSSSFKKAGTWTRRGFKRAHATSAKPVFVDPVPSSAVDEGSDPITPVSIVETALHDPPFTADINPPPCDSAVSSAPSLPLIPTPTSQLLRFTDPPLTLAPPSSPSLHPSTTAAQDSDAESRVSISELPPRLSLWKKMLGPFSQCTTIPSSSKH